MEELEPWVFGHYLGVMEHNVETTDPDYTYVYSGYKSTNLKMCQYYYSLMIK